MVVCVLAKRCVPGGEARRYILAVDTKQTGYRVCISACWVYQRSCAGKPCTPPGVHCGGGQVRVRHLRAGRDGASCGHGWA